MSSSLTRLSNQPAYVNVLRQRLMPGETELAAIRSDLSADGSFGKRWIVLTDRRVIVLPSPRDEIGFDAPLAEIVSARAKTLVGGGELEIATNGVPAIRFPYTASESRQFMEFAKAIEDAKTGSRIETRPPHRVRCEQCGRLLPDRDRICPACLRKWDTFRRIAQYLGPHRKQIVLLVLSTILISAAALVPPVITGWIVDRVLLPADDLDQVSRQLLLAQLVIVLFLIHLASWGAQWIQGRSAAIVGAKVTADIRSETYHSLEMLSLRFFSKWDVGSLIARVSRDVGALQNFLLWVLPHALVNVATFVGILAFMLWLHWKLALYISSTVPGVLFLALFFWRSMSNLYYRWWQAGSRFSSHVNEALSGACTTKMFRQEAAEIKRFGRENERLFRAHVLTGQRRATILAAMGLVTTAGVVILWFYGGLLVQQGKLTPGELVAFYGFVLLLYGPLQWFGRESNSTTQAFTAAQRIFEILDARPEALERSGSRPLPNIEGRVTFRNVQFGYERARLVLRGIDLDVRPGEFIGIVGRSGVGKTTLMHLLCRFYDPDQGVIQIDGLNVREVCLADFRKKIGVVLQEPFLFSGTIAENIRYGKPNARFTEIVAAARAAFAHEFILQKADGYDARIGEGGKGLSQGEKQRIALARCLICDPRIVILDEATSSVDPISERAIQRAANQLRRNRTTFAIAHRLSTLRNADRIIVLENGRIFEEGTYSELVERGGTFSSLLRLQYQTPETVSIED
jgi:ATP-binding cassette subfamily B protein